MRRVGTRKCTLRNECNMIGSDFEAQPTSRNGSGIWSQRAGYGKSGTLSAKSIPFIDNKQ